MANQQGNVVNTDGKPVDTAAKPKKPKPLFKKLAQFQTPDGKIFQTQKEASEHLRVHLVVDALKKVVDGTNINYEWLLENRIAILKAFDAAKIERPPVSEETKAKMKAAREKIGQAKKAA